LQKRVGQQVIQQCGTAGCRKGRAHVNVQPAGLPFFATRRVEKFWALCPIFRWPQPVPLMSQPAPFAPHVPDRPICPKSVPLMSWPAHSQFPSCPSLLPLPDPCCIVSLSCIREQKFVFCQI